MKFLIILLILLNSCKQNSLFSHNSTPSFLIKLNPQDKPTPDLQAIDPKLNIYLAQSESLEALRKTFPNSLIGEDLPIEFYQTTNSEFPINLENEKFVDNKDFQPRNDPTHGLKDPLLIHQTYLPHYNFSYPTQEEQNFLNSQFVAVVDTGVDYNHQDLNIYKNLKEIPSNNVDDDQNGFIDDFIGYDFADDDSLPFDTINPNIATSGHGTSVAGAIAAKSRNGFGISGIAPSIPVLPLKIHGKKQTLGNALRAIAYAVQMGAKIINNSWGYPVPQNRDHASTQIAKEFFDDLEKNHQVILVFAAGNGGINVDQLDSTKILIPAGFKNSNFLVVGAKDSNGIKLEKSNYGNSYVDIFSVSDLVLSLFPENRFVNYFEKVFCPLNECRTIKTPLQGTSLAAALTTGELFRYYYHHQDLQQPEEIISAYLKSKQLESL